MKIISVPIESITFDPANLRKHPDRNLDTIKSSLNRFGQQTPVVIDAKNVVRKGNGTLAAAIALGWKTIKVTKTDLKGSEATAYAIADNRSSELAEWDVEPLADTLRALQDEGFDVASIGYTDEEIDAFFSGSSASEDGSPEDFQSYDETIATDHECPKCGYKFSGGK